MNALYVFELIIISGALLFLSNFAGTLWWISRAQRTQNIKKMLFAHDQVIISNVTILIPMLIMFVIAGFGVAALTKINLFEFSFLNVAFFIYCLSIIIWLVVPNAAQMRQMKLLQQLTQQEASIPTRYWELNKVFKKMSYLLSFTLLFCVLFSFL